MLPFEIDFRKWKISATHKVIPTNQFTMSKASQSSLSSPLYEAILNNLGFLQLRFSEKLAHFMTVSFLTRNHTILYGPAGCGKTTSTRAAYLTALGLPYSNLDPKGNLLMQVDADSQMSPGRLFGGAVASTRDGITSQVINYERGVLSCRFGIIDEAFDAPVDSLTALKGVLLRKVHNDYSASTEMMSLLSNKTPKAIVESALPQDKETVRALMERCLQFLVDLPDYSEDTFFDILNPMDDAPKAWKFYNPQDLEAERKFVAEVDIDSGMLSILAGLAQDSTIKSSFISPRSLHLLALPVLKASAYLHGRNKVTDEDLEVLTYCGIFAETTLQNRFEAITRKKQLMAARDAMQGANEYITELETLGNVRPGPKALSTLRKRAVKLERLLKETASLTVPEVLHTELSNLRGALSNLQESNKNQICNIVLDEEEDN